MAGRPGHSSRFRLLVAGFDPVEGLVAGLAASGHPRRLLVGRERPAVVLPRGVALLRGVGRSEGQGVRKRPLVAAPERIRAAEPFLVDRAAVVEAVDGTNA